MRSLLLAAVLALAPATAFAYCPTIPDDASTGFVANQGELTMCRAAELQERTALKAQQLQFQADLQASLKQFELEQRMQQTFAAAAAAAAAASTIPQFN